MWSWGLQGSRIQVHKSQVVNEQNSDFSSIVLDPLPYLVVSNATRRYFIFSLWCFNHPKQFPWFSLNRVSQERPCQAIRSSQSCLDTWWQRRLHWRNNASENIAKPTDRISNNRHHFHFQSDDGDKAVVLLGHENKHFKSEQVTNNFLLPLKHFVRLCRLILQNSKSVRTWPTWPSLVRQLSFGI